MRIETREQLIEVIAKASMGQDRWLILYTAYGNSKSVYEDKYYLPYIHIGKPIFDTGEFTEFLYCGNQNNCTSLNDLNIGAHYNDNWWFTTREEAEEYINPPKPVVIIHTEKLIPEWIKYAQEGKKINAIKALRSVAYGYDSDGEPKIHISLTPAKAIVEGYMNSIVSKE